MEIPDKAWVPIGAVTAALIAAFISFVNVLIAKDQKITEFRQAWINSLRDEIARFVALALAVSSMRHVIDAQQDNPNNRDKALDNMFSVLKDERARCSEYRNRIILFLNPEDDQELIKDIESLYSASAVSSKTQHADIAEQCAGLLAKTQILLKREWQRVKRGEPLYVATKFALLIGVPLLFSAVAISTKGYWWPLVRALLPQP